MAPFQNSDHGQDDDIYVGNSFQQTNEHCGRLLDNTEAMLLICDSELKEDCAKSVPQHLFLPSHSHVKRQWARISKSAAVRIGSSGLVINDNGLEDFEQSIKDIVLEELFRCLAKAWEEFLAIAKQHVELAEARFYTDPADDSRAPQVWADQAAWAQVSKLMHNHSELVRGSIAHTGFGDVIYLIEKADLDDFGEGGRPAQDLWTVRIAKALDKLEASVREDLQQPTATISDQMYKAVAYRDTRDSLRLSLSLWRLSWITFIFLPLTCEHTLISTSTVSGASAHD